MGETAIRVTELGKRYRIGHLHERHDTLRDALTYAVRGAVRRAGTLARGARGARAEPESIWALRDVSFEVKRGEVVGIIGTNGAGKSTLLKILSRITEPTLGEAEVHGRVGSLLEVGTGFHFELSGRENIYLNGAVLGMMRHEIDRKFDEIVAFAEVEKFIDTPVKRYSSGMYLRLAFAVAAHLEPEILIVDEVLAVGDAAFQKKCLGKMSTVAGEGRTVLFVSHNMDAIQRLCTHGALLEGGRLTRYGDVPTVVSHYLSRSKDSSRPDAWIDLSRRERTGTGAARFTAVRYTSANPLTGGHAFPLGPLEIELEIESDVDRQVESMAFSIWTQMGTKLVNADIITQGEVLRLRAGRNRVRLRIDQLYLNPGLYTTFLWLASSLGVPYDRVESAFDLEVVSTASESLGATPKYNGLIPARFELLPAREDSFAPAALSAARPETGVV